LIEISRHYWWAWPLRQLAHLPGINNLFRLGYRWIARHRGCTGGDLCSRKRGCWQQRQPSRFPDHSDSLLAGVAFSRTRFP
jgi:hypothetical protein